jgi:hypothetical protein
MLNELEQLRRSLSANGIQTSAWHPWIKPLAKYTTLLVGLNSQGEPASVVELQRERAARLRNIQPDNQKSFPAFNLNCPVFESPVGVGFDATALAVTCGALESVHLAYEKRKGKMPALDRLRRLLREFPASELAVPLSARAADPMLGSTLQLLKLLNDGQQSPEEFLRSFAVALFGASQRGDISNELVLDVLFGRLGKKGGREPWQCILFLDLEDLSPFHCAVADPNTAAAWSAALLSGGDSGMETAIECALDGRTGPGIGDKMPNPNLPLLGGTYLFSMNSEIPCQSRYGRSSTAIFPVTRHAIQGANDALLHMTALDHKGKTWSPVPSGTGDKPDLLIAYIEETPDLGSPAAAFGTADEEDEDDGDEKPSSSGQMSLFIGRLNALLNAVQMEGGSEVRGARHLRLFVLSTIDKGRKQVLFDARYNVANIEEARDRWVEGTQNVPPLQVQVFQGKGKKTSERSGSIPSPLAVARSFRDLWIRKGERREKVAGISLQRLYKLLLDPDEGDARSMLERYLPLKVDLLIAAGIPGRNENTGEVYVRTGAALSGPARLDLLTSVGVFGILLNLLRRTKGTYMNERDYLLGQLLQFADRLHIVYCYGVRGGQVPPQLIGNSLMAQAGQNPAKALAVLQQRLPVYERYATQLLHSAEPPLYGAEEKEKEKARLAKLKHKAWKQAGWIKATLARLSAEVHRLGLEPVSGPGGQAELLLGYLAAPGKDESGE